MKEKVKNKRMAAFGVIGTLLVCAIAYVAYKATKSDHEVDEEEE